MIFGVDSPSNCESFYTVKNKGVQVGKTLSKSHYRSRGIMCKPYVRDDTSETCVSVKDQSCSPIKCLTTRNTIKAELQ